MFVSKLWEIAHPDQNSMCPPPAKVNKKGALKKPMNRNPRSTKRDPSYWEYVDALHFVQNSNSPMKHSATSSDQPNPRRIMPMLDQFQPFIHDFIDNIVDVKADGNYGYRSIASLLELGKFSYDYIKLFGGTNIFDELRMSLPFDGLTKMDITEMGYVITSRYNVILVSLSQQQSMTFFPLRSQSSTDSSMHRIICIGHIYDNHFVQYRHSFTYTSNQFRFQCMQLKNDDDVNTMLMCNHQFSCVAPIELLCTIGRTPNNILNLLEATMTPTHDALLYYNERWNMPRQNEFVDYSFTGKNPKKFDIPFECTFDELKDLIKQVAPHGIPPYGIHESQTVKRLFFRQPSHYKYSDKVIKFEIIELKTNDDVLKVLVQSNYWKQFGPIEILVVMEMEDDVSRSQHDSMQN
ncbi:hypothetical protein HKD37_08G022648 [Glycine soja]